MGHARQAPFGDVCFLHEEGVGIERSFRVNAYKEPSNAVTITVDASPFGMGAFIARGGDPKEWFAIALSEDDIAIFGLEVGDCAGQQTWECLTAVIAPPSLLCPAFASGGGSLLLADMWRSVNLPERAR